MSSTPTILTEKEWAYFMICLKKAPKIIPDYDAVAKLSGKKDRKLAWVLLNDAVEGPNS